MWTQAKRGKLHPVIVLPQHVEPIPQEDADHADATDPDDYDGFSVLLGKGDPEKSESLNQYALLTHGSLALYEGRNPSEARVHSVHRNPFMWEQVADTRNEDGGVNTNKINLPGMMLTFWHRRIPLQELIPAVDVDIVELNREINIVLSVLMDELRMQGFSVPWMKLNNPSDPRSQVKHGSRFPIPLDITEDFGFANAAVDFAGQVGLLKDIIRMMALSRRMSANDFNPDGAPATSGFAKLVDSLPKLEARDERIRRLTRLEEQVAAPRLNAIGIELGKLDRSVLGWKMRARFADVEFPRTEDEQTKRLDREIKYNLTTAERELAAAEGISIEEAEERIEDNREKNSAGAPAEQPAQQPGSPFGETWTRASSRYSTARS